MHLSDVSISKAVTLASQIMEPSSSTSFDPSTLTFRNYLNQQSSAPPSVPAVPPYQELAALRQELVNLSDNAAQRYEKFSNELARLDGSVTLSQPKDSPRL